MPTSARAGVVTLFLAALIVLAFGSAAQAQNDQSLRGTLRGPTGGPVAGVAVIVSRSDTEIGRAASDAQGQWEVELAEPGTYDVRLDVGTLPAGLQMRQPGGERLTGVTVRPEQRRAVIFALVAAGAPTTTGPSPPPTDRPAEENTGPGFVSRFADQVLAGLQFGMIIAITSVGLSLVFGTTRLINFAHGELVTLGAVTAYFLSTASSGPQIALIAATVIALGVGALAGVAVDKAMWRPLRRRGISLIGMFIITIGLSLVLRHLYLILLGSSPQSFREFNIQREMQIGPFSITPRDLIVIALSIVVLVAVGLWLRFTRIGTAVRAVADNRELAEASGINVSRIVLVVWTLGGSLAALGGVFFGLVEVISWDMGFNLLLLMFAGVILGGLGTAYGAMAGGLVIGLVAQLSTLWFPSELQNAWALLVLIIVLLVRPQGILGRRERIG